MQLGSGERISAKVSGHTLWNRARAVDEGRRSLASTSHVQKVIDAMGSEFGEKLIGQAVWIGWTIESSASGDRVSQRKIVAVGSLETTCC